MHIANVLSRAYLPDDDQHIDEVEQVNAIQNIPITSQRLEELRKNTQANDTPQHLKNIIPHG